MASSRILLSLLAFIITTGFAQKAQQDPPQILDIKLDNFPPPQGRVLSSGDYPQIRIHADYSFLQSAPSDYSSYVQNELVPPVVSFFEAALRVKYPVSGNLYVPSSVSTVCGYNTPSILLNGGVPADFFIFYDSTYDTSSSWVGESFVCYMAQDSNRPLVVTTNLNRAEFLQANGDVLLHEKNTYLIMHEMTHVFGFVFPMYPYFIDEYGNTRKGHIFTRTLDGSQSYVVNVPPLTQRLRNHFGCASLEGAYMENDGSIGTAGSHFERRHFINEYMTSGLTYQQRISEFTFAMLEGTGWYAPDYDYAEPYFFGQGQGCGFLFNSCNSRSFNYDDFCDNTGESGCTPIGRGSGRCLTDVKSDGCQYHNSNINTDCENENAAQFTMLPDIQSFGRYAGSKCFSGSLSLSGQSRSSSFCFKYQCQGSGVNTVLNVQVGSATVRCTEQEAVQIDGYYGSINCPDPLTFCSTVGVSYCPRSCMGRGQCQNGKCHCYKGYQGLDCGLYI